MTERADLIQQVADAIADYREGEIKKPDYQHVDTWISQFPTASQAQILQEFVHVLGKAYMTKAETIKFLNLASEHAVVVGKFPRAMWDTSTLLDIQEGGNSQHEFVALIKI